MRHETIVTKKFYANLLCFNSYSHYSVPFYVDCNSFPNITVVTLEVALVLSTSLIAAIFTGFDKLVATAFWLVIINIYILNTIASVAVSEMFEFYGDIQGRSHFLPTTGSIYASYLLEIYKLQKLTSKE